MTEPHELAMRDTDAGPSGWLFTRKDKAERSLSEVHGSIPVPQGMSWARHLLAFSGPGYMVAVGYMDPGNWATDIAGGSKFAYTLLSVIMISNLIAILLQALSARLGIAHGEADGLCGLVDLHIAADLLRHEIAGVGDADELDGHDWTPCLDAYCQ